MTEWLTAREAAELLGVTPSHVGWLAQQGQVVAEVRQGRRWVDRETVERLAEERAGWVSYNEAAQIAGCAHHTIWQAVRNGEISSRRAGAAVPALPRAEVEAWAVRYAERRQARAEAAAERRAAVESGPPDDEHVWLNTETTALVLGLSPSGVRYRAQHGLIPCVRRGRAWWFRRDHIEQAAAAQAFARRHDETAPSPRG